MLVSQYLKSASSQPYVQFVAQSLSMLETSRCTPAPLLIFWGCPISRACPVRSLPGHPHDTSLNLQHRRDLRSDAITRVRHILSLRFLFY